MAIGVWILGDQLWMDQAALSSCPNPQQTSVILIESLAHIRIRTYHQQKLILVWSAMRHFAQALQDSGWLVTYVEAENFTDPLNQWIQDKQIHELRLMQPIDRPFTDRVKKLELPCDVIFFPNNQFLWDEQAFLQWASNRQRLLLEDFYREGRKRFQVLMSGKQPIGGKWNLDQENRKPPKSGLEPPLPLWFEPDAITQAVIQKVSTLDLKTYGQLEPFRWAVSRTQALQVLTHFLQHGLPNFGTYQDAMLTHQDILWHSLLSPYLNLGLLHPLEVIQAVEQAYHQRSLPLNSIEGFIRQVLGWREYMRGLYCYTDGSYGDSNWFGHHHPLPEFYWDCQTDMNCLHQVLDQVNRTGYAHHIQRLMLLSNFALISGASPQATKEWFHSVFIDAYDWVMQTNVLGMGQFADGGLLASKPYASSANYINKMSDYCRHCSYDRTARTGEKACPFNFFYWDFLSRHHNQLKTQGRMGLILRSLEKIPDEELQMMQQQAREWHLKKVNRVPENFKETII